jgi:hypothetical protein
MVKKREMRPYVMLVHARTKHGFVRHIAIKLVTAMRYSSKSMVPAATAHHHLQQGRQRQQLQNATLAVTDVMAFSNAQMEKMKRTAHCLQAHTQKNLSPHQFISQMEQQ